ncbi:zinc finger CCHC-type and RNA-binding motif-containing protein 1 isoform X2 [Aplysia californica]|uniref:Zinc finger CCHC-type and RNA-binding motif-containing protein 1 isoform X2 n=1 Tax=Aplysia californica TaxID=6500 RepID=A0ABM0JCC1_APLCA|nr:zinc finger CCHC-type and RNA-binding motif-containing protein 1 isoform X2 [Aplysia californica]
MYTVTGLIASDASVWPQITILRDKHTRESKGVAFVLFLDRDGAHTAVRALNKTKMFERTISCSIAKDNGRAPEFIRRREYLDKSRCYECGEEGHLSYKCPKNLLGEREPPPKKKKKRKHQDDEQDANSEESSENEEPSSSTAGIDESLAAAIQYQQAMMARDISAEEDESASKRKKYKKDAYFSDEEELDD